MHFLRYLHANLFALKKLLYLILLLICTLTAKSQNLYLAIEGRDVAETKVIDSLSYKKIHTNAKAILEETSLLSKKLSSAGYLESRVLSYLKLNDTTFLYKFATGKQVANLNIYTGKLSQEQKLLLNIDKDTITVALTDVESFMNTNIGLLEKKGYSISSLQLINYKQIGKKFNAALIVAIEKKRTLDDLVLEGYSKFPEGIRRNILKQYKGETFNQENLQRVYADFNALRFVTQPRYPEILFKTDTTKVYVYLGKSKSNTFDGFIGFSNDDQSKVRFNGYVDLLLNNVLNTGEKFNLYWKSDGNKQTTFNVSLELPYMFKSPIGAKVNLRIFKQDSTFQNTVTDLNLGYYFNYNSKLYAGYQQTQSVDILNTNTSSISDYSNTFYTSTYEYAAFNNDDFIFPQRTSLQIKGGTGKRNGKINSSNQYFAQLNFSHNLYLNKRNVVNIKNQTYYLKSGSYIINELYRFGGINSIRGFNENSLQANLYSALMAEYRYVIASNMYIHTITDYGYYQDETSLTKNNLLGLGFGFGLFTNTGLFNIIYANGSSKGQEIKLSNSIIHISFKASF
jgi:hypothetical protein